MDFALTEEQQLLKSNVIRFAQNELNRDAAARDRHAEFPADLWKKCAGMGILGLPVPKEYGGSDLDPLSCAIVLEGLGYACEDAGLVFSVCAHLLSCVVPIWKHGNEVQRHRFLPGLCEGTLVGVHAMSEPGSGSDAFSLRTTAIPEADGYRLNGTKTFVSNGPVADVVIVFALTDPAKGYHGGISAFVVARGTRGVQIGRNFEKMGLRTSPIGEVVLDDVFVGSDALLGGIGAGVDVFVESMDWERTCLFASHVGMMERLLEKSIRYARTRRQFGQAIGKFQAVSHKISDMKMRVEAARLLIYRAAWGLSRSSDASLHASLAKLFASEALLKTALDTVQIHGGYGYMTEYEVERSLRDAVGATIYSGTSEMQRNVIARWLGL